MKIGFTDFWTGFDPKNNIFYHSLKSTGLKFKIVKPHKADVVFFSCFGNNNLSLTNAKKIFFLSEDFKLENFIFDYSISHIDDNAKKNNFRFPLWKMYIDWFEVNTYTNPEYLVPLNFIDSENEFTKIDKEKFCSIVYSSEYYFREKYINLISEYKKIDVYGKNKYNNYLKEGEYFKLKHLSKYKFSLAMENEISSGYLCEKLLHAKIVGNIPLFYGDDSAKIDFNPKSFIHITDFNEESLVKKIIEIDEDHLLYKEILEQPLFVKKPVIDDFIENLYKITN